MLRLKFVKLGGHGALKVGKLEVQDYFREQDKVEMWLNEAEKRIILMRDGDVVMIDEGNALFVRAYSKAEAKALEQREIDAAKAKAVA